MAYPETAVKNNNELGQIELELKPELKRAGIVESYILRKNNIEICLNHIYNGIKIIFTVNRKNWNENHVVLQNELTQKGVSSEYITLLCDVLDYNYDTILSLSLESEKRLTENDIEFITETMKKEHHLTLYR